MPHRDAKITLIVGKNGTGKSTFAESLIKAIGDRALVVSFVGAPKIWHSYQWIDISDKKAMETFTGIRHTVWVQHEENTLKYIFKNYRGGLLVFDDCRDYLDARIDKNEYFRRILTHFRHHMIDPVFIAHSPVEIPRRIWGFNYTLWIGATDQQFDKTQLKSFSAEKIIAAQQEVNRLYREASTRNDGSHYGIFKWIQP